MIKVSQLSDRLPRIHFFPTCLAQVLAHLPPVGAPSACICLYRSLNSSRPRLMRIFAAERLMPRGWDTSSYDSPSISQRTSGILRVLDIESRTMLVSCRSLIASAIRSAVDLNLELIERFHFRLLDADVRSPDLLFEMVETMVDLDSLQPAGKGRPPLESA